MEGNINSKTKEPLNTEVGLQVEFAELRKANHLHNKLTELVIDGQGLDFLTEKIASLIGNLVVVEDPYLQVLAYSFPKSDSGIEQIGLKALSYKDYPPSFTKDSFSFEQYHIAAKKRRPVRVAILSDTGPNMTGLLVPMITGNMIIGYLSVIESHQSIGDVDVGVINHAATIISLEMVKQRTSV